MQLDPIDVSALTTSTLLSNILVMQGTYPNMVYYHQTLCMLRPTTELHGIVLLHIQELNTGGWVLKTIDVSAHAVSGVVSLRFRGESGGDSYDYMNDLLVDDVCVGSAPILGCTDPLACNYDSSATIDDGSCISAGCTDSVS